MDTLASLKEYATLFGRGLLLQMVPQIACGMVNELFHRWNMNVTEVTVDVQNDRALWDRMEPEIQEELRHLMGMVSNLDFITPELIIEGITTDFPAIASLFLGWPEGMDWLTRQTAFLKAQVGSKPPEAKKKTKRTKTKP